MRLLLDSHILLAMTRASVGSFAPLLSSPDNEKFVSAASFWEIAIKHRLAKLDLALVLEDFPAYFESLDYTLLPITPPHAIEALLTQPPTRDPFDRMLLAQCQVEGLRLVTTDRALVDHPLAWRAP
ncbi:MAG TPA: type II toxin-antitoxin system VapC family toxin [Rhizomicrobium sp.]|jgi:PIN domain nuclease of toxin-antitoxin system|nr:type II toxin-antitoxin system VapC family toxin [Rhizomicrobium sp.]